MKRQLTWMVILTAFFGMGLSMPGCPGGQAMQQQIDALNMSNSEMTKKVQMLEGRVNTLNNEMGQVKQILQGMAEKLMLQKQALDKIAEAASSRPAPAAKGKAPAKGKVAPAKAKKKGR